MQYTSPTHTAAWEKLEKYFEQTRHNSIIEEFESDSARFDKFSLTWNDFLVDFSKNRIDKESLRLLIDLVEEIDLKSAIEAMFGGEKINMTENRAVLHVALRNRSNKPIYVDGEDVMPAVNHELEKMKIFSNKVHSGEWKGFTGKPIKNIVNICPKTNKN